MSRLTREGDREVPIRTRADADVPACAALLRKVYATDGYPVEGVGNATEWMYPAGMMAAWVAGQPGEVLGHVTVCEPNGDAAVAMLMERLSIPESAIAVLARLFVAPDARGKGLGQKLAGAAFYYATQKRRHAVFDVMEKDRDAIRIYERLGCVLLGRTSHVTGDRVVPALCYAAPGVL